MSIMGMRRRFSRHLRIILWLVILVFAGGILLYSVGSKSWQQSISEEQQAALKIQKDVIALVDGEGISRFEFEYAYSAVLQRQAAYGNAGFAGLTLSSIPRHRFTALNQLAPEVAIANEARKRGFEVTTNEVKERIALRVDQFIQYTNESLRQTNDDPMDFYAKFMIRHGMMPRTIDEDIFRKWMNDFTFQVNRNEIEREILADKLRATVISNINVTEADLLQSFDEANLDYIEILAGEDDSGTLEAAGQAADKIYSRLQSGAAFKTAVNAGGEAGTALLSDQWVKRSEMRDLFGKDAGKAVFALKPGEFTKPLESEIGYHIVKLNETRRTLPKYFDEKKQEYLQNLEFEKQSEAWADFADDITKNMNIEPKTPEIAGLVALSKGETEAAIAEFEQTMEEPELLPGEVYASICYLLGQYYFDNEDYDKAIEYFDRSLSPMGDITRGSIVSYPEDIFFALGQVELAREDKEAALEYFRQAEDSDVTNSNYMLHIKLLTVYESMGDSERAAEQSQWLELFQKEQERLRQEAQARAEAEAQSGAAQPVPGQPVESTTPDTIPANTEGSGN